MSVEPRTFGSGWISGGASIVLGLMGLGGVFCLLFPAELTTPDLRAIYPMGVIRGLIELVIILGFVLGLISIVLRKSKILGLTGLALAIVSLLLGGWQVPVDGPVAASHYLGLDWFLLDLLMMSVLFVPPLLLQFFEIVFVSDLFFYWTHRLFHRVPFLWRVHAVHHSPRQMDWLAGSRLHILEIVIVRAVMFTPLFICGFAESAMRAYVVFVALHAVLIHANVRFNFGWLEQLVATPRYHQFHHASDGESIDTNFAVHLPWLDRVFGTQYFPPNTWPAHMGIAGDPVPRNWWAQLVYPFRGD